MLVFIFEGQELGHSEMSKPRVLAKLYAAAALSAGQRLSLTTDFVRHLAEEGVEEDFIDAAEEQLSPYCCGLFAPDSHFTRLNLGAGVRDIYVNMNTSRLVLDEYAKKNHCEEADLRKILGLEVVDVPRQAPESSARHRG
ncbi:MAG TPA: hypothetical protein VJB02_02550 [Coxiellaceae bacterium]|nr:hypothetical protein [Coxiellaceae bacterium]